jgi:EmrB/QacA subfamily drug resistance transporter
LSNIVADQGDFALSRPGLLEANETAVEDNSPAYSQYHPQPNDPHRWWALAAVLSAAFLGPLDFFIVNIAIPSIKTSLDATPGQIQLVIACYGLTYAVLLVTGGRLGDIVGRKTMFMIGMGGFTLASALCGLAHTPIALILGRTLQGMMGAMMSPQVLSIIHVSLPPHERRLAFGIFGVVVGLGAFAGNVLGGELIKANIWDLGWRPIFLVNLPIGMVALLGAYSWVRETRSPHARKLDPGGVALATVTLFLMVFPFVEGREAGWPLWTFLCLGASVPLTALFIYYERLVHDRGGAPLVELTLFRDRTFVIGLCCTLIFYAGPPAFALISTVYLQDGAGFSAQDAGRIYIPFCLAFLAASMSAVRLSARMGSRVINLGIGMMMLGLAALLILIGMDVVQSHWLSLIPAMLVYGAGQGLVMPTLTRTVLSNVSHGDVGSASGLFTTTQQIAMAVGVTVISSVFYSLLGAEPERYHYPRATILALLINMFLFAVSFVLTIYLPHAAHHDAPPTE